MSKDQQTTSQINQLLEAFERLNQLIESIVEVQKTIKTIIPTLTNSEKNSSNDIKNLPEQQTEKTKPKTPGGQKPTNNAKSVPSKDLGPAPNINDNNWPESVPEKMIVTKSGPAEKKYRALQIIGLLGIPINGKRVLDCGCGDGFVTAEISHQAELAVGYDIIEHENWEKLRQEHHNILITADSLTMLNRAPYDVIILYDVLDQLKGEDPTKFLKSMADLLDENGQIFIRTHPWTSKHGGGIYDQLNKAYVHLALTTSELIDAGVRPLFNLKISRPMATYEKWFTDAGLKLEHRNIIAEPPHSYICNNLLDRIIKITWGDNIDKEQAIRIMSNQFIDYTLRK